MVFWNCVDQRLFTDRLTQKTDCTRLQGFSFVLVTSTCGYEYYWNLMGPRREQTL